MSIKRIVCTIRPVHRLTAASPRECFLPTHGPRRLSLHTQTSSLLAWKTSHLHTFMPEFTRKIATKSIPKVQSSLFLKVRTVYLSIVRRVKSFKNHDNLQNFDIPRKMRDLVKEIKKNIDSRLTSYRVHHLSTGGWARSALTRRIGATASVTTSAAGWFYYKHTEDTPITGRRRFMIMTPEEIMTISRDGVTQILNDDDTVQVPVERDAGGRPDNAQQARCEVIHQRLRSANPEVDLHLMPGGHWKIVLVKTNWSLWNCGAVSFDCGDLIVAEDLAARMTDDELAFLLAHETAHAVLRHEHEEYSHNLFFYHIVKPVFKVVRNMRKLYGEDAFQRWKITVGIDNYIKQISKACDYKGSTCDRRVIEEEADSVGMMFAAKACYNVRKGANFVHKLHEFRDEDILATHGHSVDSETYKQKQAERDAEERGKFTDKRKAWNKADWDQYSDRTWGDLINSIFNNSNLALWLEHPSDATRYETLTSKESSTKVEKWRREARCGSDKKVQTSPPPSKYESPLKSFKH